MSAVVLALSTPLYAVADANDAFILPHIPTGEYSLHIWVEGVPQAITDKLTQRVHLSGRTVDLGVISIPDTGGNTHTNKFR